MGKTKKVGKAGRFKARYGVGIRKKLAKVESKQKSKYVCPRCGFTSVKREKKGVFHCLKCNNKFAGGAYFPITMRGNLVNKMVVQKSFLPSMTDLEQIKTKDFDELEQMLEEAMKEAPEKKTKKEAKE